MRARIVLVAGGCLLAASCGGGGAKVTLGPGTIAFVSTDGGDYAVYLADADGTSTARLTKNPDRGQEEAGTRFQDAPAWSPDGAQLAIDSNRTATYRLYLLDPATGHEHDVGVDGADPAFSPDGRRIVFDGPAGGLSIANGDGTGVKRLTGAGRPEIEPSWSPGGQRIAFVVQRRFQGQLWIIRADGTGAHRLTHAKANETSPVWSPDGKLIAFSSSLPGTQQIYVIRPDGSGLRRVTVSATDDTHPSWSPDGKRIAYARADGLFVVGVDGKGARLVIGGNVMSPSWRPS